MVTGLGFSSGGVQGGTLDTQLKPNPCSECVMDDTMKKISILTGKETFQSLKPLDLSVCDKQQILAYFNNSYDLYESLFTSLKDEKVFYLCPDRLRLPLVFYFAHTAVVYVNKLVLAGLLKTRVNLEFETMFETGVDEMSWDDTENYRMGGSYKWPTIESVVDYRRQVRNIITNIIEKTPLELPINMESPWWALVMGMEHERIHLETSAVLIRQLPVDMVTKPSAWMYAPVKHDKGVNGNTNMHYINATDVTMGKPEDFPSYGWDNEYGQVTCHVPAFEASKFMITNGEYLEFVKDGGYNRKGLWSQKGWQWKEFRQLVHPVFWVCTKGCNNGCGSNLSTISHCEAVDNNNGYVIDDELGSPSFRYRVMFDNIELPLDWPVEVTYHEAKAFCAWKGSGYRLPAEAEQHVMRGPQKSPAVGTECDMIHQDTISANLNLQYGSSTPVNLYKPNTVGLYDIMGNVWEWNEDHFNGFENFKSHHFYDDFSTPTFDGKHHLILGGSWISTGNEASRFARYAFRPHFVQFAGFRTVRNLDENKIELPIRIVTTDVFVLGEGVTGNSIGLDETKTGFKKVDSTNYQYTIDTDAALYGILQLEFGIREGYPEMLSEYCLIMGNKYNSGKGNCAVFGSGAGKIVFILKKYYDTVLGVDAFARYIQAATTLQETRRLSITSPTGDEKEFLLDQELQTDNVCFKQLTWIANEIVAHDLILMTNLHRLQNPKAWLLRLWEIVKMTGIVVIFSMDNQWKENDLLPILSPNLSCIESEVLEYQTLSGIQRSTVTVWKHHWCHHHHTISR
ncbi:hypothetical protein LOTGIDRAFT_239568 [Lottia gigantea]|uniref:Sulfatase-modifying factor enzyme domain-containing protein n=1 Tax=Lottia gigantea TaxID=225164 RepID=V3ZNI9_LOTGI|nr:hypothetical protein LOTGIDRAFT_239568 [Lottia gigantea]ESO92928.1 hypothetical protein LOTGIDRAFT_239568 [Lottia gigantea]